MPHTSQPRPNLLTISEACQLLGVSEATLRQWTDEGKVKAFITPGGHRRYDEANIKELLRGEHRTHGLRDLVAQIEGTGPRQREIAQEYLSSRDWYSRMSDQFRKEMGQRGKLLIHLIVKYISRAAAQDETLLKVRTLGREYGAALAGQGFSLSEALESFVLHRSLVTEASTSLLKDKEPLDKRTLNSIPKISYLVDQTLLALVEGHQSVTSRESTQGDRG